jgi:hypothetical protein
MANATDYLENLLMPHVLGITAMPMPVQLYVALCTDVSVPSDATPGTEVSGDTAYTRAAVQFGMVSGVPGEASNVQTLQWAIATVRWGNIPYIEVWDAASGGNRYFWLPLVDPTDGVTLITVTINAGDIMRIPASSLILTVD